MSVYRPTYKVKKTGKTKESRVWWYHFTFAGHHYQESSKSTRKTIATEAERNRRLELEQIYNGVPTAAAKAQQRVRVQGRTVTLAVKDYQTAYGVNHRPKAAA